MKKLTHFKQYLLAGALMCIQSEAFAFAKGADVSWITEMEYYGVNFYNDSGTEQDVLQILKDHGMDSIRLRVWVNPANGWSDINDVIVKAQRAKNAGMRIMIDFHYSDSWADPGKQYKPADWESYDINGLMSAVWWHTYDSLNALKNAGITPEWVQVGNETNNGMLWEEGKATNSMQNFAWLINSGHDAAKDVFPNTKVIVHLANCHDNANFRWIFDGINQYGAKYDVIGASAYPTNNTSATWAQTNNQCLSNLNDMVSRYDKDVMVTEVGAPWDDAQAKDIIADMIAKVRQVNNGRGLGIFYWEPQASNWNGYTLGAWDPNTGRPTQALDAFLENAGSTSASETRIQSRVSNRCIDISGAGTANGDDALQWSCHNNDNQKWQFIATDSGYYQIKAKHSGLCLDVNANSSVNGANVVQWTCSGGYNQQFIKEDMGDGYYRLKARHSGKCLDINAGGTSNGDSVIQWACHSNWNQQWRDY
ncbi:glycosyl hydrolase 53 family protein [Catenovulum sp. 2E275]|uniref:glycosyl hydrolase 53 family protein n=1 Tax=Catenovulum sp. 2E275 TaxID=2980497 RepID=UPI0021CEB381|nr:glycosyl hydrolase 53 family protein [Catenovulum sp. 2E275]MCU4675781.1 glycosyl hydrolase 53 family protein [Catenovulum sp. 2E275]